MIFTYQVSKNYCVIVQGFKKVMVKRNGGKVVIPAGMMIERFEEQLSEVIRN